MPVVYKLDPADPDDSALKEAAQLIRAGKLVIYPTETFYGLGALYCNEQALDKIFQIKGRQKDKPLLLLIPDIACLYRLAYTVPEQAMALVQKFWPGPLTLLFTASAELSDLLIGNKVKVGCRISSNPVAQGLLSHLKEPLTSTSSNASEGRSPTRIDEIPAQLIDSVDLILDAGETSGGLPSTVFDLSERPFTVMREGAIPAKVIFETLGPAQK
jgi:L-threonylcarbamoyladenylate synthase